MSRIFRANSRKWQKGQRGAALVEAALLSPIIFGVIFGMLEFGWAFHDKLTVSNIGLNAARRGSTEGNDPAADFEILKTINSAAAGLPRAQITNIVIYHAAGPTDTISSYPLCKPTTANPNPTNQTTAGGGVGSCNSYTYTNLSSAATLFGGTSGDLDLGWVPTLRKVQLSSTGGLGPPDYIGIYIRVKHNNLTRLFGSSFTYTDDSILRMEPQKK